MDLGGLWLTSNFEGDFGGMKFQGRGFDQYLKNLRKAYERVSMRKPKASRARSPEVYALALGKK